MWQLLLLITQDAEELRLSLPLGNGNKPGLLGCNEKSHLYFCPVEWCHPLSSPECRKRNTSWGKILAKSPQKKVRSSQHWMDYSLYWVLGFLFSFTEHLGFILDFRKTFLGNPTLSSKFWSGLEAGSPGTLVYCLLKNGTALLIRICTILVLSSRECVGLNLPPFSSATLLWWNESIGFVSLVFVSRLFFSSCFLSMSSLFNVHMYLI